MNRSNARRTAYGGVLSALSLALLLLSGLFPFAEYSAAALSGIVLAALVIDFSRKTAWLAYGAVSLLGLLIVPNKESALLFLFLLGYYPIVKSNLEQLRRRPVEWACKLLLFNGAVAAAYWIMLRVLGMTYLLEDLPGPTSAAGLGILLIAANAVFVLYDLTLSRLIFLYCRQLRPRLQKLLG